MRFLPLIIILWLLAVSPLVHAADADKAAQDKQVEVIENISRVVQDHMAGAMIEDGHIITEDEAKKLKYPLIPFEERKQVVIVGEISGLAALCGLDWKMGNYLPLMSALRGKHKGWTDYQYAYASMLHGASMQIAQRGLDAQKICTDGTITKLKKNMIFQQANGN